MPIHRIPSPTGQPGRGGTSRPPSSQAPRSPRPQSVPPPQAVPRPADIGNLPRLPISTVGRNALSSAGEIARSMEMGRRLMDGPPSGHGPAFPTNVATAPRTFTSPGHGNLVGTAKVDDTPRYFTPNDVQMRPLRDRFARTTGVMTTADPQEMPFNRPYASAPGGRLYTFLANPGVRGRPVSDADIAPEVGKFHPAPGRPAGVYPPAGSYADLHPAPKDSFFIIGHMTDRYAVVTLDDGTAVRVSGSTLAKITFEHNNFRHANQAYSPDSYTMIGCLAGRIQDVGGTAHDFQSAMVREFGTNKPLYAPTEPVYAGRYGGQGITYVENGGWWNTFGGP